MYKSNRAPLVSPPQVSECPLCGCKTVQLLKDGRSYCTRVTPVSCPYDSKDAEKEKAEHDADTSLQAE